MAPDTLSCQQDPGLSTSGKVASMGLAWSHCVNTRVAMTRRRRDFSDGVAYGDGGGGVDQVYGGGGGACVQEQDAGRDIAVSSFASLPASIRRRCSLAICRRCSRIL
jgi:hypothetical protein